MYYNIFGEKFPQKIFFEIKFSRFGIIVLVYYNILGTKILPQSVANFAGVLVNNSATVD